MDKKFIVSTNSKKSEKFEVIVITPNVLKELMKNKKFVKKQNVLRKKTGLKKL